MKVFGAIGSFPEYWTIKNFSKNTVFITESIKRSKEALNDLKAYRDFFKKKIDILEFPDEQNVLDIEAQIKRNYALYRILKGYKTVVVTTERVTNLRLRDKTSFLSSIISIKESQSINREELIEKLIDIGYIREDYLENEGEFSVKGNFVSIFVPFIGKVDLDFFGDEIESIFLRSKLETRKRIESVDIFPLYDLPVEDSEFVYEGSVSFSEYMKDLSVVTLDIDKNFSEKQIFLFSKGINSDLGTEVLPDFEKHYLPLKRELFLKSEKVAFLSTDEKKLELDIEPLLEGDYIVHEDYGIGIYRGIETREIRGKKYDFMILEYADGQKIYVSYLHFDKIHKYNAKGNIVLDRIGGTSWRNLKKKVKNSLRKLAKELIKLYVERENQRREPLDIDNELVYEFEREFPYVETPDQIKAIKDVKNDFLSEKPMERLLCGDVGFGKTEVAIRAIFINAVNGRQSVVLVPTTVLAFQHYMKLKERLKPYGIVVENLSRFTPKRKQMEIIENIKRGKVDVVVATHKILHSDIEFKNLGLLIIDEEHRFGVRAKEKLRALKKNVDTLYITATPIPRTLHMALSGLKDISVINTPPEGRYETKTFVSVYDKKVVERAIRFELDRNGQVFYLHNRIESIEEKTKEIKDMFPKACVEYVHGRMKPSQIEKVFIKFINREIDILVSTSIIETGIDVPTANTLIVERADLFGLAQLYHLRGRIGRGNIQAYCYFLTSNEITEDAEKRLTTLMKLTRPGSGLKVSMEDMKIRGPGNIFGVEQSGFVKAIGFDMYVKLLKEAINEESGKSEIETEINTGLEILIPDDFIPSPQERLNLYKAISESETVEEIKQIEDYLKEFYFELPETFKLYIEFYKLKKIASQLKIKRIDIRERTTIEFSEETEPYVIKQIIEHLKPQKVHGNSVIVNKKDLKELREVLESINKEKPAGKTGFLV